jgi:hypothetical protein
VIASGPPQVWEESPAHGILQIPADEGRLLPKIVLPQTRHVHQHIDYREVETLTAFTTVFNTGEVESLSLTERLTPVGSHIVGASRIMFESSDVVYIIGPAASLSKSPGSSLDGRPRRDGCRD